MRVGGIIFIKANGQQYKAKGSWTCNKGSNKREGVVGADGMHGYKEMPQVPYCEGAITDELDLDTNALNDLTDATITIDLANGKTFLLEEAWFAGEGNVTTEEGEIAARFEGMRGDFIR